MMCPTIPELFTNPTDNPYRNWYFPITPQQINLRFLQKVKDELYHIYEHCEITDEPEGPWSTCQHVTHQAVEDLEKLEWNLVRLDASLNPPPPIKKEGEQS